MLCVEAHWMGRIFHMNNLPAYMVITCFDQATGFLRENNLRNCFQVWLSTTQMVGKKKWTELKAEREIWTFCTSKRQCIDAVLVTVLRYHACCALWSKCCLFNWLPAWLINSVYLFKQNCFIISSCVQLRTRCTLLDCNGLVSEKFNPPM